jgi:hypothetical protein
VPQEQLIGTVDVWKLRHFRWPFMRALCRQYVERRELQHYEHELLATRRWTVVRCVPHPGERGAPSAHIFDVYGVPASPSAVMEEVASSTD